MTEFVEKGSSVEIQVFEEKWYSEELLGSSRVGLLEDLMKGFNLFRKGQYFGVVILMEDFQNLFRTDLSKKNLFRTANITLKLDHCGLPNGLGVQYTAYPGW